MTYFTLMQQLVESLGGRLLTSKEFREIYGIYTPDTLPPEQRRALSEHMEERISQINHALSSSGRKVAHRDIS